MAEEITNVNEDLQNLVTQGTKVLGEVKTKLTDMQAQIDALEGESLTEAGKAALTTLKAQLAELDALVPDADEPDVPPPA